MVTTLLDEISLALNEAGVEHFIDAQVKRFDGNKRYISIKKSPHRILFTDFFEHGYLQAIAPLDLSPQDVQRMYNIGSEKDAANEFSPYPHHYILRMPYTVADGKALLNGTFEVHEKKQFFIDVAKRR